MTYKCITRQEGSLIKLLEGMRITIHHIKLLFICGFLFIASCSNSEQHEVNVDNLTSAWSQEFIASNFPFPPASLKVSIKGRVSGAASIEIFESPEHKVSIESKLIGPGNFEVEMEEPEYWYNKCLIRIDPKSGAEIISFQLIVKFGA